MLQHLFDHLDFIIYRFLELLLILLAGILADLLIGFRRLYLLEIVLSDIPDGDLSFLCKLLRELDKIPPSLFGKDWNANKNAFAVILWIQSESCLGYPPVNLPYEAPIPGLDA